MATTPRSRLHGYTHHHPNSKAKAKSLRPRLHDYDFTATSPAGDEVGHDSVGARSRGNSEIGTHPEPPSPSTLLRREGLLRCTRRGRAGDPLLLPIFPPPFLAIRLLLSFLAIFLFLLPLFFSFSFSPFSSLFSSPPPPPFYSLFSSSNRRSLFDRLAYLLLLYYLRYLYLLFSFLFLSILLLL